MVERGNDKDLRFYMNNPLSLKYEPPFFNRLHPMHDAP